jgi:hypothetical protein
MSKFDLGEEGRNYLRVNLGGEPGIAGTLSTCIIAGESYTHFPVLSTPVDFESGGGIRLESGTFALLSEVQLFGDSGDVLALQDVWALEADHAATPGDRVTVSGSVYLLQSWDTLALDTLDILLRRCISFKRVLILIDAKGASLLQKAKTEQDTAGILSSVKLLAVSAFDQEGYVFWRP